MNQAPVAVRFPEPEPADAAMVPCLAPQLRVEVAIGAEGRVDLIAMADASLRKVRTAGEGQGDVGQHGDLHR